MPTSTAMREMLQPQSLDLLCLRRLWWRRRKEPALRFQDYFFLILYVLALVSEFIRNSRYLRYRGARYQLRFRSKI
ncbi:hypothetical protein ZWY2020_021160 [Hordeum vulgare]|nr:hypothetical protein ZWY2020_021160 [Hordeum vulgare]